MRSSGGWLTPASLRDGLMEEYAIAKDDGVHTVVLGWAGMGATFKWQVKRSIVGTREPAGPVGVIETHSWYYEKLNQARDEWTRQVQRTAP